MPKRAASESPPPAKRFRPNRPSYITRLSDELLLRITSFLAIRDLISCQQVSKRFSRIAGDGQIWKSLFYRRFVRPRASRIPGLSRTSPSNLHYSSRTSRWLEDEGLSKAQGTNWKELYKLRHNWNRGSCGISEIDIGDDPALTPSAVPPLLVRMHEGVVFTVDSSNGLRAWRLRGEQRLIASLGLYGPSLSAEDYGIPSALAVDEAGDSSTVNVAVGFEKGGFAVYQLNTLESSSGLILQYVHPRPGISAEEESHTSMTITAMAYSTTFLLSMTRAQLFTIHRFSESADNPTPTPPRKDGSNERMMHAPQIVASLRSHTVWPPVALSLRRAAHNAVFACIVYAFPLYPSGWSVGIQELRLADGGRDGGDGGGDGGGGGAEPIAESRIATAVPVGFAPIASPVSGSCLPLAKSAPGSRSYSQRSLAQPTCVSYTHPYLLASHSDNTLTLHLVKSTATSLSIDSGQRLWGHTSAVSTAQVGNRGKAVSVSSRGSELRVWELEGGVSERRRVNASVKVEPQVWDDGDVDPGTSRWLGGFDEEKVVVLEEKGEGKRGLVVYDFTY